jgi:hypothetical protein
LSADDALEEIEWYENIAPELKNIMMDRFDNESRRKEIIWRQNHAIKLFLNKLNETTEHIIIKNQEKKILDIVNSQIEPKINNLLKRFKIDDNDPPEDIPFVMDTTLFEGMMMGIELIEIRKEWEEI